MLSQKVKALLTFAVRSDSGDSKQNPLNKIGVIFWVAVAIRKFQRFESEKYKNLIEYNFDKQAALEELKQLYAEDEAFCLKEFVKLGYFIRKFCLTFTDLISIGNEGGHKCVLVDKIIQHLSDESDNHIVATAEQLRFYLCLSLKYLTRNSCNESTVKHLKISQISPWIRRYDSLRIKTELVALLAYLIEKSNETLNIELSAYLENLVLNLSEVTLESKAFFFSKLEANKAIGQYSAKTKDQHDEAKVRNTMAVRNVKKKPTSSH